MKDIHTKGAAATATDISKSSDRLDAPMTSLLIAVIEQAARDLHGKDIEQSLDALRFIYSDDFAVYMHLLDADVSSTRYKILSSPPAPLYNRKDEDE